MAAPASASASGAVEAAVSRALTSGTGSNGCVGSSGASAAAAASVTAAATRAGQPSTEPTAQADITHRRHAIIETVFADLIDGPLAHLPSGRFAANSAWAICAAMTHNLLRAAGTLTSPGHAVARGATLRRHIVAVPARIARPQRRRLLHLPAHWPWADPWNALWHKVFVHGTGPPLAA